MTERSIQNALFAWLAYEKGYLMSCPNYTPADWFENDLFAVTRAGFAVEFEIKISVSDFRADAKKGPSERERMFLLSKGREARGKHERLAERDPKGPSRFFYVVPEGLVTPDQVPEWAGLIHVRECRHFTTVAPRLSVGVAKDAPRLHRVKACPKVLDHCRSVFYHRFWNLRRGIAEQPAETTTPHQP